MTSCSGFQSFGWPSCAARPPGHLSRFDRADLRGQKETEIAIGASHASLSLTILIWIGGTVVSRLVSC